MACPYKLKWLLIVSIFNWPGAILYFLIRKKIK
ncbi:PLDc N-terminal domain-containing protein [Candidatus Dojkabacteria bacterium]|nr:PLDc N-terminal domain-containing protein [Candidatus Dojkabacteria bacterium]